MSNYTDENLVNIQPSRISPGTLAIKIGDNVFTAGNVTIDEYGEPYVVIDDNGVLKAQPLSFDGTTPQDNGEAIALDNVKIFETGHQEPTIGGNVQLGQVIEKDGIQKFVPMVFDGTSASEGNAESFTDLYTYNTANPTPEPAGGGSIYFYKCASVGSGTWTGYLASVDSVTGIWSFAETATSGLTYGSIAPAVGKVYNSDCTVELSWYKTTFPTAGLIRKLSLSSMETTDEADSSVSYTYHGNVTFPQDSSGVHVCECGSSSEYVASDNAITSLTAFTFSIYMKHIYPDYDGNAVTTFSGGNTGSNGNEMWIWLYKDYEDEKYKVNYQDGYTKDFYRDQVNGPGWHHFAFSWDGQIYSFYIDGKKCTADVPATTYTYTTASMWAYVNSIKRMGQVGGAGGQYAMMRIYNRVLAQDEIFMLAHELPLLAQ